MIETKLKNCELDFSTFRFSFYTFQKKIYIFVGFFDRSLGCHSIKEYVGILLLFCIQTPKIVSSHINKYIVNTKLTKKKIVKHINTECVVIVFILELEFFCCMITHFN